MEVHANICEATMFSDEEKGMENHVRFGFPDGRTVFFEGGKEHQIRIEDPNGRKWFYEGEKGKEHRVRIEFPDGKKQFFEGEKGKEHQVRYEFPDGEKRFFEGEKGKEHRVRIEYSNGRKVFYEGEEGKEMIVRVENPDEATFSVEDGGIRMEQSGTDKVKEKTSRRGVRGGKRRQKKRSAGNIDTEDLLCPISFDPMIDAVTASDGMTYSRRSISRWFRMGNTTSPLHGNELENTNLVNNNTIASLARSMGGNVDSLNT